MRLTSGIIACLAFGMTVASVGSTASAASVTGVTDDSIKIGVMGPLTGPAAAFGKAELGLEAFYKSVNEAGGINGRKIRVVLDDTACNSAQAIAVVKKLISQDKVFMIDGGSCSDVVLAIKPLIVKAGLPYMVGSAADSRITSPVQPNVFAALPNTEAVGRAMIDFAMTKDGARKIAFISQPDAWGKSNLEPAIAELKSKYGLDPTINLTMVRDSTDATPQVLKLLRAKPDVIIAVLYPAPMAIFERDAYRYGLHVPVIANQAISIENMRKLAGGLAEVKDLYVYYPLAAPVGDPSMDRWKNILQKYSPGLPIETSSMLGISGAIAVVDAMKHVGQDLTGPKLIDALDQTRSLNTGVLGLPITFTPKDHAGVKGGQFITYSGNKLVVLKRFPPEAK